MKKLSLEKQWVRFVKNPTLSNFTQDLYEVMCDKRYLLAVPSRRRSFYNERFRDLQDPQWLQDNFNELFEGVMYEIYD